MGGFLRIDRKERMFDQDNLTGAGTPRIMPMSDFAICADRKDLVRQLLEAKQASGKTYTEIAKEVGLTNLYTAQLFQHQVHVSPCPIILSLEFSPPTQLLVSLPVLP